VQEVPPPKCCVWPSSPPSICSGAIDLAGGVIFRGVFSGSKVDLQFAGGIDPGVIVRGAQQVAVQQVDSVEVCAVCDAPGFLNHDPVFGVDEVGAPFAVLIMGHHWHCARPD